VYWLGFLLANKRAESLAGFQSFLDSPAVGYLALPVIYWSLICVLSSLGGIDQLGSLAYVLQTSIYLLLPFCIAHTLTAHADSLRAVVSRIRIALLAFVLGHSLSCILRVIYLITGGELSLGTPGPVTQSGQLVLVVPLLFGLFITSGFKLAQRELFRLTLSVLMLCAVVWLPLPDFNSFQALSFRSGVLFFLAFYWRRELGLYFESIRSLFQFRRTLREDCALSPALFRASLFVSGVLIGAVILLNLKRGPWLAIFSQIAVFGLLFSRKALLLGLSAIILAATMIAPVRQRAAAFFDDFTIAGGRQTMWSIGVELSQRYPLGLGPHNARFMRELDSSLPESHRHMHNNLLNVAVEVGWLGLAIFAWLFFRIFALGFKISSETSSVTREGVLELQKIGWFIALSVLGWQIAGLVEYNFGDGEVRIAALMLIGLLLAAKRALELFR
jgi:O-antigen ligase